MHWIKQNWFKSGVLLAIFLVSGVIIYHSRNGAILDSEAKKTTRYTPNSIEGATEITCTYPQFLHTSYANEEIKHSLQKPEDTPIVLTFSDFESDISKLKSFDSTKTISEYPLIKVLDTSDRLVFVEGNGNAYIATHMISKKNGVAIYSKEVDVLGIPVGSLAMGTCVGY